MTEPERLVTFELLGQEYRFFTAASEEELASILALVRELVENDPANARGTLASGKAAILACLNVASQYVQLKSEFERYKMETESRFERLSAAIENNLTND